MINVAYGILKDRLEPKTPNANATSEPRFSSSDSGDESTGEERKPQQETSVDKDDIHREATDVVPPWRHGLKKDPILLHRLEAVFTEQERGTFWKRVEELQGRAANGQISFSPVLQPHADFILFRMAYELTFLMPDGDLPAFSMIWDNNLGRGNERHVAFFIAHDHLKYQAGVSNEYVPTIPFNDDVGFDLKVAAESGHFAQQLLRDAANLAAANSVVWSAPIIGFDEAIDHLLNRLYRVIKGQVKKLTDLNDRAELFSFGHSYGAQWAQQAADQIDEWIQKQEISPEDAPRYIRAYARLFTLVNIQPLVFKGARSLSELAGLVFPMLEVPLREDNRTPLAEKYRSILLFTRSQPIDLILSQANMEILLSLGLDIRPLKLWIQEAQNQGSSSKLTDDQIATRLKTLRTIMMPMAEMYEREARRVAALAGQRADHILSLDRQGLLKEEAQTLRDYKIARLNAVSSDQDRSSFPEQRHPDAAEHRENTNYPQAVRDSIQHVEGDERTFHTRAEFADRYWPMDNHLRAAALAFWDKPDVRSLKPKEVRWHVVSDEIEYVEFIFANPIYPNDVHQQITYSLTKNVLSPKSPYQVITYYERWVGPGISLRAKQLATDIHVAISIDMIRSSMAEPPSQWRYFIAQSRSRDTSNQTNPQEAPESNPLPGVINAALDGLDPDIQAALEAFFEDPDVRVLGHRVMRTANGLDIHLFDRTADNQTNDEITVTLQKRINDAETTATYRASWMHGSAGNLGRILQTSDAFLAAARDLSRSMRSHPADNSFITWGQKARASAMPDAQSSTDTAAMASIWRMPYLIFDSLNLGWMVRTTAAVVESALLTLGGVDIERFVGWHDPMAMASARAFAESMQSHSYWRHTWEHIIYNNPLLKRWRERLRNKEFLFESAA